MKLCNFASNIMTRLTKKCLIGVLMMMCTGSVWGATYLWTGGAADNNWTTPGNWNLNNGNYPTATDTVIIKADAATEITIDANVSIKGIVIVGTNTATFTSAGKTFTADAMFIGSSNNHYRTLAGLATIDTSVIPNDHEGNLVINGATVSIGTLDTSSWVETTTGKNTLTINSGSLAVTTKWDTGENIQNQGTADENRNRTEIINYAGSGAINVIGEIAGADDNALVNDLVDAGADIIISDLYIWKGGVSGDWNLASNWSNNTIPDSTSAKVYIYNSDNPSIAVGDSFTIKELIIDSTAKLTINGEVTIPSDYTLSSVIDELSSGTLKSSGKISTTAAYSSSTLSLESTGLELGANLECNSVEATNISTTAASKLSIAGTLTNAQTTWPTDLSLEFKGTSAQTFTPAASNYPEIIINSSDTVTFSSSLTVSKLTVTTGTLSTSATTTVTTAMANSGTISGSGDYKIAKTLTDSGTWNSTGKIIFNGTGTQSFAPRTTTTYYSVEVDKTSGTMSFETNKLTVTTITLTAGNTNFNSETEIGTLTSVAGAINFNNTTTIKSDTTFATTDPVTFKEGYTHTFNDGSSDKSVTNTSGTTNLYGDLVATSATLSSLNITGTPKVTAAVSTTETVTATSASTLQIAGDLTDTTSTWSDNVAIKFIEEDSSFSPAPHTYGSIELDCAGKTVTPQVAYSVKTLTVTTGTLSTSATTTVTTEMANSGTISGSGDYEISGTLTDTGTWNSTGKIIFNGTSAQTFVPVATTIYNNIEVDKTTGTMSFDTNKLTTATIVLTNGTTVNFNKEVDATNLTITKTTSTTFADALKITGTLTITEGDETTFTGSVNLAAISDTATAGKINFNAGGTITSATTFTTTATVKFGDATADSITFGANSVTHTAGATTLYGTLTASTAEFANLTIGSTSTLDGDLKLSNSAYAGSNLTIKGNITTTGTSTLGTSTAVTIILNPATKTFTNNGTLTIPHSTKITGNFINEGTLSAGGSATTSTCAITGNFTNKGAFTIPSNKYFAVTGTVDDSLGTSWNTGNQTGTLLFNGTDNQSFIAKTNRTYPSINVGLTAGKKLSINNNLTINELNVSSGNIDFTGTVSIGTYSETGTPSSDITFTAGGKISSVTTMVTTGTVTIPASQTLTIADSTPTYKNFSHTAGTTEIAGEIKAAAINLGVSTVSGIITASAAATLGTTTISGTTASVSGTSITTGAISATTDNTDKIELKASTGTFTLGAIGASGNVLNTVTLDAGTSNLGLTGNSVYATNFILKTTGNISLTKIDLKGDLNLNTTNEVALYGDDNKLSATAITFASAPSKITLGGTIEVTGASGFVIPASHPEVALSVNTTITTSTGPITLYDNITGGKTLTITNAGLFTLYDTTTADPANATATPASAAVLASFTQNGNGSVLLAGDINASGNISFTKAITLADNAKLSSSAGTIIFTDKIDGAHLLITSSNSNTQFSGAIGNTTAPTEIYTSSTNGNVTLNSSVTSAGPITVSAKAITVYNSLTTSTTENIIFSAGTAAAAGTVTFNGPSTSVTAQKFQLNYGNLTVNKTTATDTLTFSCLLDVAKAITITKGKTIFNENVTAGTNFTNNSSVENNKLLTISGNFTDSGTFTENANSIIALTGTGNQDFTPVTATSYKNISIDKSAGSVSFKTNNLNATKLSDSATNKCTITFNKNTTIKSASTLNTTGTITVPAGAALTISDGAVTPAYYDFVHSAGNTSITGSLNAKDVTLGTTTLSGIITASGNVYTQAITLNGSVSGATISLPSVALNGDSSLTATTVTLRGSAAPASPNTLIGATSHTLTINGNLESDGYYNIGDTVAHTITLNPATNTYTNNGTTTLNSVTFTSKISNNGTLSSANTTITGDITNTASHSLTIAGNTTLNGSLTNAGSFTIDSGKTFQLSNNFTNSGTATLTGSTFELIDVSATSEISGNASFHNFTAAGLGGKTIKLNDDVTVTGSLTLSGTAAAKLTITDDGSSKGFILTNGSQPDTIDGTAAGSYLSIGATVQIKTPGSPATCDGIEGTFYKASDSVPFVSTDNAAYANVLNNGWRIKELKDLTYTWTGSAATSNWTDRSNWDINIVPGVTTAGQTQSTGATVIIPDGKSYYPVLATTDYTLRSLTIGTSGAATHDASLTLNGTADLSVITGASPAANGTLSNYSKIIYSSSGRIKGASAVINDSSKGIVEFKTATDTISDVPYYDLIITSGTWNTTNPLTVRHNLAVSGGTNSLTSATINNDATISGGTSTFSGAVTVSKNLSISGNSTFNGLLTISGTNGLSVTGAPVLTINAGLTCTASAILIPANAVLTLGETINSGTNSQTYKSAVTLSGSTEFKGATVTFEKPINVTTAGTETLKISGDAVFETAASIGNTKAPKTIEVTGTTKVKSSIIKSTETQKYIKAVTIDEQNVEFASTSSELIVFNSTLTGTPTVVVSPASTTYHDVKLSGKVEFNGNVTNFNNLEVTDTATVNADITTGNTTFHSDTTIADSKTISATSDSNTFAAKVTMGTASVITAAISNTFQNEVTLGNNSKIETTGAVNPISTFHANINAAGNIIILDTPVTITDDISLTASTVIFRNNILGIGKQLTLNGTAEFSDASEITADIINKGTILVPAVADIAGVPQSAISFKGSYTTNDATEQGSLIGSTTENPYIDFYKDVTFGNFTSNGDTVRLVGAAQKPFNPNSQSFTDIIFDNGTTTISENLTADNIILNSNGQLIIQNNKIIYLNKNWTNKAGADKFTANQSTLILQSANQTAISGNNKFYNLTCEIPDKTLIFENEKTQEIQHALEISGADNQPITLKSSVSDSQWNIKCTGTSTIKYVNVQDSNNTSSYRLNAESSTDSGHNERWNFTGKEYIWTGASNTDWFNETNWNRNSVPGIGTRVTIPEITSPAVYPVLENDLKNDQSSKASLGATGTLTIAAKAEIDFADKNLTVKSITNNGRIRLSGGQTITGETAGSRPLFSNAPDSTVEYYGSLRTDKKAAMGTEYFHLKFTTGPAGTQGAVGEISEDLSINGTTVFTNGTGKSLTLSGLNTFTGDVAIGQSGVTAGSLIINSASNIEVKDSATCDDLTLTASETVTFKGSLTTQTDTNIDAQNNVIFNGNVTTGTDLFVTTLQNSTFKQNIYAGSDILINSDVSTIFNGNTEALDKITVTTPSATVKGNLTAGNASEIKLIIDSDKAVTFNGTDSTVSAKKLTVERGSIIVAKTDNSNTLNFNLPVTIGTDLSVSKGTVLFNNTTLTSLIVAKDISILSGTEVTIKGTTSAVTLTNNGTFISETTAPLSLSSDLINRGNFENNKSVIIRGNLSNSGLFTANNTVKIRGNFTNTATCTNKAAIEINGDASSSGTITANADISIDGNFVNTGSSADAVTNNQTISIKGNLTDTNGKWKEGCGIILFNGTDSQNFNTNPLTKYFDIRIVKPTGDITITSALKANSVTITKITDCTFNSTTEIDDYTMLQAENTQFTDQVQIGTFTDDNNSGNITFTAGGTISSDTTFRTTGKVTFGNDLSFGAGLFDFEHIAGITDINKKITAKNITLKTVTGTDIEINNSGTFILQDNTSENNVSTADLVCDTFLQSGTGENHLSGDITTNDNLTFATPVILTGNVQLTSGAAVTLNSSVDDNSSNKHNLIVVSTENVIFRNTIGETISPCNVSIEAQDNVTFNGNVTTGTDLFVTTLKSSTFRQNVYAGSDILIDADVSSIFNGNTEAIGKITVTTPSATVKGNLTAGTTSPILFNLNNGSILFTGEDTAVNGKNLTLTSGDCYIEKASIDNSCSYNLPVSITGNLFITKGIVDFNDTTAESLSVSEDISISQHTTVTMYGKSSCKNLSNNGILTTQNTAPLYVTENFTNTATCTNNAAMEINGDASSSGTITANADISIDGNFVNTGSSTDAVTNNQTISIKGDLTDTDGKWKEGCGIIVFNGTNSQNFNTNSITTYYEIQEAKTAGTLTITSPLKAETVQIKEGITTDFTKIVNINTFKDSTTAGDIIFQGAGTIGSDTNFITTGSVQFGKTFANLEESESVMNFSIISPETYFNVTHTKGTTILYGKLNANNISFAQLNCNSNITINCAELTLNGNVDTTATYLKVNGDVKTTKTLTILPHIMLNGSFTGSGQATLERNLYVFNEEIVRATPSPITINTITVKGDIIVDSPRVITTENTIKADNFILYRGNITANEDSKIITQKDIILLGENYNIKNDESGNAQEFLYQQTRLSPYNYNRQNFTSINTPADKMPDGNTLSIPSAFTGTYNSLGNSILKAGKNFYANGTELSGTDAWYIELPDVTNALNGFAEAVNTIAQNSVVRCFTNDSVDGSKARMPAYFCTDNQNNKNWIFDDFEIVEAQTERDDSIKITFNRPIRNSNSELINSISRFHNSADTYYGFYTDADTQQPLEQENISSGIIYIKAPASWNTDATGTSSGTANSTDRAGNHKEIVPYLQITTLTTNSPTHISDIWGKRLLNYDSTQRFVKVTDHTGPVLYSVRTGQEQHTPYNSNTGAEGQPSYDAHNFIEFRYSEKVNFGDTALATTENLNKAVFDNTDLNSTIWLPATASTKTNGFANIANVRVRPSFGTIENDITIPGQIIFSGLGTVESGLIHTGKTGTTEKTVNALYRTDAYSIRLSIAGYTENTVTDRNGDIYKKWIGYIENAQQPSGTVNMNENINMKVTDCAVELDNTTPLYNPQELYKANKVIPTVNQKYATNTDYSNSGVYGNWDISEPVFAPLRLDKNTAWGNKNSYEAVGNTSGSGSTLDKIEFHFFDNSPAYDNTDNAAWLTEKGWCFNTSAKSTTLYRDFSYCADIIGGSRQFDTNASQRTTGGLRYSTVHSSAKAFKYIDLQTSIAVPNKNFDQSENGVYPGAKASLFTGSATIRRNADDPDGLYFGLGLTEKDLPVTKSFTISYNEANGYITDLAGNRLRSAIIKTIDRTPPSYNISFSPLNQNELYIVFVKKVISNSDDLEYRNNDGDKRVITENFEHLIPKCFELISIDSNGTGIVSTDNQIDYNAPARIENITSNKNGQDFTVIRLKLKKNVTLPDVENLYIRTKIPDGYDEYTQDPITGISNSRVSFIQDSNKNYMQIFEAHTLSDFAISSINPLYAYDADMTYQKETIMDGLYSEGSWAVHDWNEDQQNYGTLPANHPYAIVANIDTGTELTEDLPAGVRIYLSASPDPDSIAKQYNSDLNQKLRLWLPEVRNGIIQSFALTNNSLSRYFQTDSKRLENDDSLTKIQFDIPKEISQGWGPNQQISFLFGILNSDGTPFRIYTAPYYDVTNGLYNLSKSSAVPLYSIRLKDPKDITSLDLWSFKTRGTTEQRGGVTILNNVINVTNGEKTVVKVNMPSTGKLNVMVMTLDGSIVTYLNHGQTEAGEHYYSWNGKNNNKGTVARGMYFIRVVGNGIDETRKVMVVK